MLQRIEESACGAATCAQLTDNEVISGWSDGHIRSHSQRDGRMMWKVDNAHRMGSTVGVSALALGKNNDIFISGGNGGEIRVWDIASLGIISHMKQHSVSNRLSSIAGPKQPSLLPLKTLSH